MQGVLVVDKPQGLTSHDVVAVARRALGESRIGHTGTLDPLATGVLPLAVDRATRLVRFLTASDKDYDAIIRFGFTTDSYDVTGAETSRTDRIPSADAMVAALATLTGDYLQEPPAFSAKKVAGQRAYDLARQSTPVVLRPVPVRVTRADRDRFRRRPSPRQPDLFGGVLRTRLRALTWPAHRHGRVPGGTQTHPQR